MLTETMLAELLAAYLRKQKRTGVSKANVRQFVNVVTIQLGIQVFEIRVINRTPYQITQSGSTTPWP